MSELKRVHLYNEYTRALDRIFFVYKNNIRSFSSYKKSEIDGRELYEELKGNEVSEYLKRDKNDIIFCCIEFSFDLSSFKSSDAKDEIIKKLKDIHRILYEFNVSYKELIIQTGAHADINIDFNVNKSLINDIVNDKYFVNHISEENVGNFYVSFSNKVDSNKVDYNFIYITNNREGWVSGWDYYKRASAIHKMIGVRQGDNKDSNILKDNIHQNSNIEIHMVFNAYLSNDDDVSNLRYYVPLWHYFKNADINCKLVLNAENDMSAKVNQFFSQYTVIRKNITLNGLALPQVNKIDVGALFPIVCFSKNDEENDVLDYIEKMLAYISDKDKYIGTAENNMLQEIKQKICNDLNRLFKIFGILDEKNKYENNNTFAVLVFLYLIKNHVDQKVIFRINEDKKWELNEYLVYMTWADAKTYAEGLLQLIENAQNHSNGKVAYFGMRIYKADPATSMSALVEETRTRNALWRKYWKKQTWDEEKNKLTECEMNVRKESEGNNINTDDFNNIFNISDRKTGRRIYSDFIEFYVLDDAIDQEGNTKGIVDDIKQNDALKKETKKKIISIAKIFDLIEKDYNDEVSFYISHYGMRWLKRHVDKLNGIMEIYSPCNSENDKGKACCYSNIFENLECATPNHDDLFSTEYSILIPLDYRRKQ